MLKTQQLKKKNTEGSKIVIGQSKLEYVISNCVQVWILRQKYNTDVQTGDVWSALTEKY